MPGPIVPRDTYLYHEIAKAERCKPISETIRLCAIDVATIRGFMTNFVLLAMLSRCRKSGSSLLHLAHHMGRPLVHTRIQVVQIQTRQTDGQGQRDSV